MCTALGDDDATVDVGPDPAFLFKGEFAVSAWVKVPEFPADSDVILGQFNGNEFHLELVVDELRFFYEQGSDVDEIVSHSLDSSFLGVWHHVVGQYRDGLQELFLDGQLVQSRATLPPDLWLA